MTLDELIKRLQEAKEHGILGNSRIITEIKDVGIGNIDEVEYDNRNVAISITII
jgi:hypothetical protein